MPFPGQIPVKINKTTAHDVFVYGLMTHAAASDATSEPDELATALVEVALRAVSRNAR
jgi:hypothetical protein